MPTYINGTKLKKTNFSIKLSGKTEDFISQIQAITNEKGYFNLEIKERKEVGKYGDTHYLVVDEYVPAEKLTFKTNDGFKGNFEPITLNNQDLPF
jgi:hypothetical protein